MKVIELLNKVANGEEIPVLIKYNGEVFCFYDGIYINREVKTLALTEFMTLSKFNLNEEVEIIEDKIKKIYTAYYRENINEVENFLLENINQLADKVNELIDEINKMKEGKE